MDHKNDEDKDEVESVRARTITFQFFLQDVVVMRVKT